MFNDLRTLDVLCLVFSWIFIIPNRWFSGIILTIISIILYLFARKSALRVQRAYAFHLYVFLAIFPFTILSITSSLWLFDKANIAISNYTLLILGFVILAFFLAFQLFQSMFLQSKEKSIESGRLVNSNKWDLTSSLQYSSKQKAATQIATGCLSPLVIGLAFYLGRNLHGDTEIFIRGIGVFFFGFVLLIGFAAYQLAIIPALLRWEKETGSKIDLSF